MAPKRQESLARSRLDMEMHAAGKGRKPGGRGLPEGEDERGPPRREVVVDGIKRSPDGHPGNRELTNVYWS